MAASEDVVLNDNCRDRHLHGNLDPR
jgi:hypothetical protein